ncbi:hypothetical protein [Bacillus pseudomycoides]|jgi:hypothetical protein|uniref:hypothetical protein n=1 Tax=Bacillus pseudomycoides TaxID=64104 RepID=UPI001482B5E0|nr:hypothetical protein [Bacillus pseudomycoides]MED1474811.1 hypothetical protein [Bacillus pseudomycoides]
MNGCKVTLGEYKHGDVIGMRVIVPAQDNRNEYQIFVTNSRLSKKGLEKFLFSIVE